MVSWTQCERDLINVEIFENKLTIIECENSVTDFCRESNWEIANDEEILTNDRKIGDIYPFKLLIFDSNEQRSLQVKVQLIQKNKIEFSNVYTNLDGGTEITRAILVKNESLCFH